MNLIDFTQTGGYRLKQPTFQKMQSAYFEVLKAFITYLQIPDVGKYIISGCEVSGANITSGIMYIDGELCPFVQIPGSLTTKIKKEITIDTLPFKSGANLPVFRKTSAIESATGDALSTFTRVPSVPVLPANIVIDANYVHTDNNFTAALLAKLNGIEAGAEVNVQADWDVINPLSDAFIKNKPNITQWYHRGSANLGAISSLVLANVFTINFPAIAVSDYFVVGQITAANNVPVIVSGTFDKTTTGFKLRVYKPDGAYTATNCVFEYYLLPSV